jgi:hypothetical protein
MQVLNHNANCLSVSGDWQRGFPGKFPGVLLVPRIPRDGFGFSQKKVREKRQKRQKGPALPGSWLEVAGPGGISSVEMCELSELCELSVLALDFGAGEMCALSSLFE